jgi:hypothetical protein
MFCNDLFLDSKAKSKWRNPKRWRKFFDEFAKSKNFDPLDAKMWYSISGNEIRKFVVSILNHYLSLPFFKLFLTIVKGGNVMLSYVDGSYIDALIKVYPELKLRRENFLHPRLGLKRFFIPLHLDQSTLSHSYPFSCFLSLSRTLSLSRPRSLTQF